MWNLDTGSDSLDFVDDPSTNPPLSPINIGSTGGDGAQAADGHGTGSGAAGAAGGSGGVGGDITVTVGAGMSGTTSSIASGITLATNGGSGGEGSFGALDFDPGVGGIGGNAGHIIADLSGNFPNNLNNQSRAVDMWSIGGNGGNGRHWSVGQAANAPDAGAGGSGGQIDLTLDGTFVGNAGGVRAQSVGGTGGVGGYAEQIDGAEGGNGGQGGNSSAVNVTIGANANIQGFANQDAGLIARSQGGTGGQGGGGGSGGAAGAGGNAGNVSVIINGGDVENGAGTNSAGLLAQSMGGNGGDGGAASHFVIGPNGGSGTNGGAAGAVSVITGSGGGVVTIVSGQRGAYEDDYSLSPGLLAQSIGGGGGGGSNAKGWFAVGGSGGNGVGGNSASVDVLANITTYGINSDGIAVQSIGGGGGKGGDAQGSGVEVQMVIGGTGGGGGDGGSASGQLRTGSVIETDGEHSHGILIQSIGGGGGMGGAAYSTSTNGFYGADISVGGNGGSGGNGNTVGLANGAASTNAGRITTLGSDSYGILGQSIGGGGGVGGASTAESKTYSGGDAPGLSLAIALGGSGGAGGSGSSVTLVNGGLITSSGAGSVGILGQSIGGGGGAGGDASSSATASGGNMNFAASFALGGSGAVAGDGGTANIANNGMIITTGESADAMLVQSIGGGGGAGGAGDAKSSANGKKISLSMALGSGGHGGSGGDGYAVTAMNTATIITLGDSAFGIGAQSIGGAGGRGGGAAASATGDISASLAIGGTGGAGGGAHHVDDNNQQTGIVAVNNTASGTIVTFGADANGIIAQSIGGGGGAGGKGATGLGTQKSTGDGGNGDATGTPNTFQTLASSFDANGLAGLSQYASMNGTIDAVNSLLNNKTSSVSAVADTESDLDTTAQSKGTTDDDNESPSIHLQVAVGGSGGGGGNGGEVIINNAGEIATLGHAADAILAQAIGGGGGKGGASSTASSDDNSGSLGVGGTGGSGGYGGNIIVNNTGTIYTKGALAAGIVAEAISGGGGIGGASASSISSSSKNSGNSGAGDGTLSSLSVSVGGNGGTTFSSGPVQVTSSGAISTAAHDSIGIIAQSISGGGGIVKTIATDLEGAGGAASAKETGYGIQFKFGGDQAIGSAGYGSGYVNVTTNQGGAITTAGANSYGILAQSISGGGGVALGGTPTGGTVSDWFGSGTKIGSVLGNNTDPSNVASNSGLFVTAGDNITTGGNGAIGILAQSIGGGGGLAGDTEASSTPTGYVFGKTSQQFIGSGAYVGVSIDQGVTVMTSGTNAPALFLQSIGGGGGRVTTAAGAYMGTVGGTGTGGSINVNVNGTIETTGQGSAGIMAQSMGDSTSNSPISVTVGSSGKIIVGQSDVPTSPYGASAGIYINHGGLDSAHANTVTNNGLVQTYGSDTNAVAVYNSAGYTAVTNNGSMAGDVLLTNDGGSGCFTNNGNFYSGDAVTVGNCAVTNTGTIQVGGAGAIAKTTISGAYVQKAGGKLVVDADFASGKSDVLTINGAATVSGTVEVNPTSLRKTTLAVVSSTGPLTVDPNIQSSASHLYSYQFGQVGNTLEVTPQARFVEQAAGFGRPEQAVASSLQSAFDSGATLTNGFAALAKVNGNTDYALSLRSIAGEGLGAFGAFRINSSRSFTFDLYGGCREMTSDGRVGDSCVWGRVFDRSTDQDARADSVGYHADAYTVEVGGQVSLSDKLALVVAAGSESSTLQDDNRDSQINGNTAIAGAALNYANGPVEVSGAVDGAYGWYRSTRTITVADDAAAANAKPRQWQIGAHLRAGYSVSMGNVTYIKPFIDGHAIYVSNDAFTESGPSPFRLAVEGQSDTALLGGVGMELGAHFVSSSGVMFHPFVSAAAEFDNALDWTTTAHFADQSAGAPFAIRTAGPGLLGRFAAGADIANATHWSFSLMYDPDVGHGYTSQAGSARVSYRF
jgi:hypothetical protein